MIPLIFIQPETQGYLLIFKCAKTARMKIFLHAQIGRALETKLCFRQFIFRMREFEQMENALVSLRYEINGMNIGKILE